ncbi:hypothetical protein AAC387_Pa02g2291 [Persea americana]
MPEVLTLSPPASTGPELALQSVAIRSVGLGHRRTAPPNSRKQEVVDSSRRLPHQVDRSRASILHHRARHKKLRMEEHHYEIWDPANSHLGQRDASNDQAEISNKVILDGLKKRLDRARGRWAEELPSVLWAYRTTPRRSTSATLFSFANGMEAVIPLEVGLPTLRSELYDQGLNDLNVARELDFDEEWREAAAIRLAAYQQ